MLYRQLLAALFLAALPTASAQDDFDLARPASCLLCNLDLRLGLDFMVGAALLGGLVWLLYWMENASLPVIAEHLFGVSVVGLALFLFLRFLSP